MCRQPTQQSGGRAANGRGLSRSVSYEPLHRTCTMPPAHQPDTCCCTTNTAHKKTSHQTRATGTIMKFFCRTSFTLALGQVTTAFVVPPSSNQIAGSSRRQGTPVVVVCLRRLNTCTAEIYTYTSKYGKLKLTHVRTAAQQISTANQHSAAPT